MDTQLRDYIASLASGLDAIPTKRKSELDEIANTMATHLKEEARLEVIVVCTHNSRRSQLGEVWINTLSEYLKIEGLTAFSGGMEETAFNHRMVHALEKVGFTFEKNEESDNPRYRMLDLSERHDMFSKVYDHEINPQSGFMALMVCGHADENCPIVFGMKYRIPLRYTDPKEFDDTPKEEQAYLDKIEEVGREIYYILDRVSSLS